MNKRSHIFKKNIIVVLILLTGFPVFCLDSEDEKTDVVRQENFIGTHITSFDLCTMGLSNMELGWGLGVNYEQQLFRFLAVKAGFNHWTMLPFNNDFNTILSVGIKLEALCYPFGNGLDKFYFGAGSGTEFIMYTGENISEDHKKDTPISIIGQVGWKQNLWNYVMLDLFCGYRYVINQQDIYEPTKKYVSQGFQYGLKIKFNLSYIFEKIRK